MPSSPTELLDVLEKAHESSAGSRIEFRDAVAAHGAAAIREIRPWLGDPQLVSFAIRVIEKAGAVDGPSRAAAIEALRGVQGGLFADSAKRDAEDALRRLGAAARLERRAKDQPSRNSMGPLPALIRGYGYRRRELREAGLLGNVYSGISYPAEGDHACLFSGGPNSESYGYRDMPSGVNGYRYYGEWRGTRDMSLTGGNKVILDRSPNLYLFINEGGGVHRFEGRFMVTGHERVAGEREGTIGEAIVFSLERVSDEVRL